MSSYEEGSEDMKRKQYIFRELSALMAKHNITVEEMGNLIGKGRDTMSTKLQGTAPFTCNEAWKIMQHFISLGEPEENVEFKRIFLP